MSDDALRARFLVAQDAARDASRLALEHFAQLDGLVIESKGRQDFVTEADRAVERLIVERLTAEFPDDAILGEEAGFSADPTDRRGVWAVDPIDGTSNFVRGRPDWAVSIGLVFDDKAALGIVHVPAHGWQYAACLGQGATRNGAPIGVATDGTLADATIGLGFSYRLPTSVHLGHIENLLGAGIEYRRLGSAAVSLALVADGRFQGYVEGHINSWDVLGGLVLVREAGGRTNDFLVRDGVRFGNPILAAPPDLYQPLAEITGFDPAQRPVPAAGST